MTYPPHDPASGPYETSASEGPAYGYGFAPGDAPAEPAQPDPAKGRTRRRIAVGATVVGALVLGGAGYAVASFLSGGGPQPEEVLPSDTIAFVKLDLDPAAGQKTAAMSLLEKFPFLGESTDDLRQDLVDRLLDASGTDLDFAEDVEPWLGDRMAVAAVPDGDSEGGAIPVLVLAVGDQQAMGDTLREVRGRVDAGVAVRDDFLLVTPDQGSADRLAAEESRLPDGDYAADLDALGGDQIAVAWADLSAAQGLLDAALTEAVGGLAAQPLSGRFIVGVHAEDDALELVGMDVSVSDAGPGPRSTEPTELIRNLPEDTLGAVSVSGAGNAAVRAYDQLAGSGGLAGVEEQIASLGIELPDDLRAVLGTDLVVAVSGSLENPAFGARVVTDDPDRATDVLGRLASDPSLGLPVTPVPVDGGYVVGSDPDVADTLTGEGGLGDTGAFAAAVPDTDDATALGFANLAALLDQVPDSGGEGFQPSDLDALEAVGFSSTPTDEGSRFVLRITTR